MLLPLPPIKNIQHQLCQFLFVSCPNKTAAAAATADKLQKKELC